jgi:uncharacterized protein (DUF2267 family)
VNYPEFIATVTERARNIPKDEAEAITRAALQTLGERITGGEARDLAAQLPKELQPYLESAPEPPETFGLDEFVRRVSQRAGVSPDDARDGVYGVMQTLQDAVTFGEFEDVMSQLPKEFWALAKPNTLP